MSSPARILIVDDTPANLSLLIDTLGTAGHEVLVAESGRSALDLLGHTTPDLILLDFVMPGLDGVATCRKIKQRPECAEIPVLFITAVEEPGQKLRAFDAGALDYITKPVHPPEVLARVTAHLQVRALRRSLEEELAMRIEAENQLSQSLDRAVLLVAPDGRTIFSTRRAENLLHRHVPNYRTGTLPAGLDGAESPVVLERFQPAGREQLTLILLDEKRAVPGPVDLIRLGLTAREAEVLYWIAQGKSNPDIAVILGAAVRTVHKHVENIFRKLGLETRHAAMLAALEVLKT
jgi:DNA-binding NarL/FixJ family response regulator